jgi:hypothetical protein
LAGNPRPKRTGLATCQPEHVLATIGAPQNVNDRSGPAWHFRIYEKLGAFYLGRDLRRRDVGGHEATCCSTTRGT